MSAINGSSTDRALRRLFLALFLRGRSARGLHKESVPKSIASKLALSLVIYALVGCVAFTFRGQPIFALALYLHGMTFVFLGMTVASSAGEVLFNKEEADILLHRPVTSRALLKAKVGVLVQVSLWLAIAFNLAGFVVGSLTPGSGWLFPAVHALSTVMQALFCTSAVVLAYELCLRCFGRERLDGLMTTVQVILAISIVIAGQLVPQLIGRSGARISVDTSSWWIVLLPPAWFGGLDDAVAGSGAVHSWVLAGIGLTVLAAVVWLAFGKLANHYEEGLQTLGENVPARPPTNGKRRWISILVDAPFFRWWLREPVTRASFLLTAAYLFRDREVKLRIYPGLAPMLAMPLVFLLQDYRRGGGAGSGFGVAFSGGYVGLVMLLALNLLQYSQQWQAAEVYRLAPVVGPAKICAGARRAVMCFLALPTLAAFGLIVCCMRGGVGNLPLLLPGIIALPAFGLFPHLAGKGVPFSVPGEEAKSANRGLQMVGVMFVSMILSGLGVWAWSTGWFRWLLMGESLVVILLYVVMRASLASARWKPLE